MGNGKLMAASFSWCEIKMRDTRKITFLFSHNRLGSPAYHGELGQMKGKRYFTPLHPGIYSEMERRGQRGPTPVAIEARQGGFAVRRKKGSFTVVARRH